MPADSKDDSKDTNGEKNGDIKDDDVKDAGAKSAGGVEPEQKLSLGEIAVVDGEIAKAKIEQLQLLHNVKFDTFFFCGCYGKLKFFRKSVWRGKRSSWISGKFWN